MVVHFQYGNGIYLRSALVALTEWLGGSYADWSREQGNPPLWRQFHEVADRCEARFRTRSADQVLMRAMDVARESTPFTMVSGPDSTPSGNARNLVSRYGLTLSSGRPLRWYAEDGLTPRTFPHLGLDVSYERSGETMFFLTGRDGDLTGRHYLVVADPWADHGAEFGELLAAVLSGGFEVGPTKPDDLRLDILDEALAAARG